MHTCKKKKYIVILYPSIRLLLIAAPLHTLIRFLSQEYLRLFNGYKSKPERQKQTVVLNLDAWTPGLCDKVRDMQRFFGLHPGGELTQETLAAMKRPRCGLSDVEPFGNTICWKKKNLSYRLETINRKGCHMMWTNVEITPRLGCLIMKRQKGNFTKTIHYTFSLKHNFISNCFIETETPKTQQGFV